MMNQGPMRKKTLILRNHWKIKSRLMKQLTTIFIKMIVTKENVPKSPQDQVEGYINPKDSCMNQQTSPQPNRTTTLH